MTTDRTVAGVDWQHWLDRWEAQQDNVVHVRSERFQMMLDVLDVLFEDRPFTALDVACGPGSVSRRVLDRFPSSRCVGVDLDPVLLAIGRDALSGFGERLRLVEADLRDPAWKDIVGTTDLDVALSSTALHWLPAGDLVQVYRSVAALLGPAGVFINCDNMAFPARFERVRAIVEGLQARRRRERDESAAGETFQGWWEAAGADPGLLDLYEERQRRFEWRQMSDYRPGFELHRSILEEAGFSEVSTLLQNGHNRVLIALK